MSTGTDDPGKGSSFFAQFLYALGGEAWMGDKSIPTNIGSPSTTWGWRKVKIGMSAGGQQHSAPKGRRWFGLPKRNPREPLTIKVKYRGGAECWYEVHARGSVGRYRGDVALHDVMSEINRSIS